MSTIDRRKFLQYGALAGGAMAFQQLSARTLMAEAPPQLARRGSGGYGRLRRVRSANTREFLLDLPQDFHYTVFGRTGDRMSDGSPTPGRHDGMAAFAGADGSIRLVRNHEVFNTAPRPEMLMGNKARAYDAGAGGGTTTLVVDAETRELVRDFISLGGTLVNCAGGPAPWGSWITCEETVLGSFAARDEWRRGIGSFERNHGYCFEVPAQAEQQAPAVPLRAMGRFVHEAMAVDPETGIVYETEDQQQCGFYRFLPESPGDLKAGGRLEMLAIDGQPQYDTSRRQRVGRPLPVRWVPIPMPDPPIGEVLMEGGRSVMVGADAVFRQGLAQGGASFARLEGCWYGNGRVYLNSTSGGNAGCGQVWEYEPGSGDDGGQIRLLFESPGKHMLDSPDNICVSPRGGIVLCEDGTGDQFLRGLTPDGRIFDFARNNLRGAIKGEFAGATFSPDGQTLLVNIQEPGLTFAIWGPWEDGAL